jgi:hypothetical protein
MRRRSQSESDRQARYTGEFTTEVAASAEFEEQKESRRVDADVLDEGEMGE